jgi:hypothetical protein
MEARRLERELREQNLLLQDLLQGLALVRDLKQHLAQVQGLDLAQRSRTDLVG